MRPETSAKVLKPTSMTVQLFSASARKGLLEILNEFCSDVFFIKHQAHER
jgi:hypothetical protein